MAISVAQNIVPKFANKANRLKAWLESIEKAVLVTHNNLDPEALVKAALLSSENPVSSFIIRYKETMGLIDWETLKAELEKRFGVGTDRHSKKVMLRTLSQKTHETTHVFAERIYQTACEAYGTTEVASHIVQEELVSILATGLRERSVGSKILRILPAKLEQAVEIAAEEDIVSHRMAAHGFSQGKTSDREEEDMDISQVHKSTMQCSHCKKKGHQHDTCWVKHPHLKPKRKQNKPVKGAVTKGICHFCKRPGHYQRECWVKNPSLRPQRANQPGTGVVTSTHQPAPPSGTVYYQQVPPYPPATN